MNQMDKIIGDKITLRRMTVDDTDKIIRWRNSDAVMQQFLFREPLTRQMHLNWIHNKIETGQVEQFIVVVNETGREIGSTYVRDINGESRSAEYGMFIGEADEKGKGYGAEMEALTARYVFENLPVDRIQIRMLKSNIASYRAAIKNGYREVKEKEEQMVLEGTLQTVIFMEVTK